MKFLICFLIFFGSINGVVGQTQNHLCVLFNKNLEVVSIKTDKSTNLTLISFPEKGFEDPDKLKQAIIYWKHHGSTEPRPRHVFRYIAIEPPMKLKSIKDINCTLLITLEDFRSNEFSSLVRCV